MTAVLLDMDGVLYAGERSLPGAAETVRWLQERGVPRLFLTNTTSRARSALARKLASLCALPCEPEAILTPPVAAATWLRQHAPGAAALFVPASTRADFEGLPLLEADAEEGAASVVIGDLGSGWDFATLNRAFRLLMCEPAPVLVALGMTRYWRADDGLRLDVAPFVAALERASGVEATVIGKPSRRFYASAATLLATPASQIVMVGDDIVGDVDGAQRAGMRGVLVRTGKFRAADLDGAVRPDAVLDSIRDLPAWWERHFEV